MLQKYFIAIVPPEPLLNQIQEIKESIFGNYGTKGALRSPAHITLHMPFSWDEEKENRIITALQDFSFNEEVVVKLLNFACFEPRVVFIDVLEQDSLYLLQRNLVQYVKKHLQLFNQSDDMRGFHPHVTIAFRDLKKPMFYKVWEDYRNRSFSASFTCHQICLLKHIDDKWEVYKTFSFVK